MDGNIVKAGQRLKPGQTISLTVPDPVPVELIPEPEVKFGIIYQDRDLIVVNKPPGLVVHPAAGHRHGTLVQGLLAACPDLAGIGGELRPGIVHRLDKDTSGVMVAAKTARAHQALVDQFKNRRIEKHYLGLCLGRPGLKQGRIDAPIGRHPSRRKEMSTKARSSKPALTEWNVLRLFHPGLSLLQLKILTGRTHQIRVHLASIGCPILGDRVYGRGLGQLRKHGDLKGLVHRHMLHARTITFIHPSSGEEMMFEAELAKDMELVLDCLEKDDSSPAGG